MACYSVYGEVVRQGYSCTPVHPWWWYVHHTLPLQHHVYTVDLVASWSITFTSFHISCFFYLPYFITSMFMLTSNITLLFFLTSRWRTIKCQSHHRNIYSNKTYCCSYTNITFLLEFSTMIDPKKSIWIDLRTELWINQTIFILW